MAPQTSVAWALSAGQEASPLSALKTWRHHVADGELPLLAVSFLVGPPSRRSLPDVPADQGGDLPLEPGTSTQETCPVPYVRARQVPGAQGFTCLCWQRQDRKTLKRINALLDAASREPFSGIGKPEPLRENLAGFWSCRIEDSNRLVYAVDDDYLTIVSCRYH
jgi:toxin YoeB